MELVRVEGLGKSFGNRVVFRDISFTLSKGDFVSIVGKSGCGKTTLLEVISGLTEQTAGRVVFGDDDISPVLLFQEYNKSIFPWLKVEENIRLVARQKYDVRECEKIVSKYLNLVGLYEDRHKYPWELSGGMQQRLALARALCFKPKLLLLDEPFGSLDAGTRRKLEAELQRIWLETGITVLLVTHDIDEAIFLSQKIIVLDGAPALIAKVLDVKMEYPRDYIASLTDERMILEKKDILRRFSL